MRQSGPFRLLAHRYVAAGDGAVPWRRAQHGRVRADVRCRTTRVSPRRFRAGPTKRPSRQRSPPAPTPGAAASPRWRVPLSRLCRRRAAQAAWRAVAAGRGDPACECRTRKTPVLPQLPPVRRSASIARGSHLAERLFHDVQASRARLIERPPVADGKISEIDGLFPRDEGMLEAKSGWPDEPRQR